MSYVTFIECTGCGARLAANTVQVRHCRHGILQVRYDLDRLRRERPRESVAAGPASLWRYSDLLPAERPGEAVTLGEGFTAMVPAPRIAASVGCGDVLVKDEGRNPSGSFKDRGASVGLTRYRELGVETVMLNSSGNAGAAWSLYAARAGILAVSILPEDVPVASRIQSGLSGGTTYRWRNWHEAGGLVASAAARHGWLNVNTFNEPYRVEGKKTMGLEIAEQLGWRLPDAIVYPVGGGTGAIAIWKAFEELLALGWVSGALPRLYVSQYEGCAPIARAFENGRAECEVWADIDIPPGGLKAPSPPGGREVLALVRATGGAAIAVSTAAALQAVADLAALEGVFACPEAGTTIAALRKAVDGGLIGRGERVVLVNSGSGLKSLHAFEDRPIEIVSSGDRIGIGG